VLLSEKQRKVIGLSLGGLALGGAVLGGVALARRSKRRKAKRKQARRKARRSVKRYRRTPRTAGKRRDTSTRRIRHTKNGQPYIILRSGKARFIKKRSARSSRKRKGGRY